MGVMLGGKNAWKMFRQRDIAGALQWVNDEPALVLWPARWRPGAGAFIVCLSSAWKYASSDGFPTTYCLEQAIQAAKVMGMEPGRYEVQNIVEAILDRLEDLIRMPPKPTERQLGGKPVGEMALIVDGKVVAEGEVEDVPGAGADVVH